MKVILKLFKLFSYAHLFLMCLLTVPEMNTCGPVCLFMTCSLNNKQQNQSCVCGFLGCKRILISQGNFRVKDHFNKRTHISNFDLNQDVKLLIWKMLFHKEFLGLSKCTATFFSCMWSFCSSGPACLFSAWGLLNANHFSSSRFCFLSPPDSSSNYIRQLETKVRILEDDNNKLLSQVRYSYVRASLSHSLFVSVTDVWGALSAHSTPIWTYTLNKILLWNFSNSPEKHVISSCDEIKRLPDASLKPPPHNRLPVSWRICLSMFNSWGVSKLL